jgi:enterochelin esterase-like enzyme
MVNHYNLPPRWRRNLILLLSALTAMNACSPPSAAGPTTVPSLTAVTDTPQVTLSPSPIPPTETPDVPACTEQPGQIVDGVLDTALVPKPMRLKLYLPPCYAEDITQRYPVLYLLHGQGSGETQWIRIGAPAAADRLIVSRQVSPFIIVMPYNYGSKQPTEDHFGEAVVKVLIPYVDGTYRTLADRDHRAVGGLSRGGGWAIHLGIDDWDVFGAFGGHSPAIFWTDAGSMPIKLRDIPLESRPRIFLDIGDNDKQSKSVQEFEDLLTDMSFEHEWHLYTGYHNEDYWKEHVEEYLRWYSDGW